MLWRLVTMIPTTSIWRWCWPCRRRRRARWRRCCATSDDAFELRSRDTRLRPVLEQLLLNVAESLAAGGLPEQAAQRFDQLATLAEEAAQGTEKAEALQQRARQLRGQSR